VALLTFVNTHIIMYVQDLLIHMQERLPQVKCPYEAPDQCAAGAGALIGNAMITVGILVLTVLLLK
jgi:hypothetical protein